MQYVCVLNKYMYDSVVCFMFIVKFIVKMVHEMDCLREETVPVPCRSGAQSSVAMTRWHQFKEGVLLDVRGPE